MGPPCSLVQWEFRQSGSPLLLAKAPLLAKHLPISQDSSSQIQQDVELDLTEQLMERKGPLTQTNVTGEGTVMSGKASGRLKKNKPSTLSCIALYGCILFPVFCSTAHESYQGKNFCAKFSKLKNKPQPCGENWNCASIAWAFPRKAGLGSAWNATPDICKGV